MEINHYTSQSMEFYFFNSLLLPVVNQPPVYRLRDQLVVEVNEPVFVEQDVVTREGTRAIAVRPAVEVLLARRIYLCEFASVRHVPAHETVQHVIPRVKLVVLRLRINHPSAVAYQQGGCQIMLAKVLSNNQ